MLIMFKAKNYTSFKNESILDLRATSYVQHLNHVIDVDNGLRLLKTIALYGANASGKSNLISAMFFFEQYIFSQFITKRENTILDISEHQIRVKLEPFLLSEDKSEASEFDIVFVRNGNKIQYGFECTSKEVLNEWYYINEKKVYERTGTQLSYGSKYQKILSAYNKIPSERLYLSVLEYFLDEENKRIILEDFITFFSEEYNVFSEILFESSVKKLAGSITLYKKLVESKKYRQKVEKYLRLADLGIVGLDVQSKTVINEETGKETKKKVVRTIHNVYGINGNIVDQRFFDLQQESTGTLRFLSYIEYVIDLVEKGGVFIIDEMSARLHPLLTKLIVDIFQASNNSKAQLIFTTHDISILNNNQFRRDEVVFIDKNDKGESTLYALSDLKVREDATFNKDYLQGKYGAIPIFDYDNIIGGEN